MQRCHMGSCYRTGSRKLRLGFNGHRNHPLYGAIPFHPIFALFCPSSTIHTYRRSRSFWLWHQVFRIVVIYILEELHIVHLLGILWRQGCSGRPSMLFALNGLLWFLLCTFSVLLLSILLFTIFCFVLNYGLWTVWMQFLSLFQPLAGKH